MSQADLAKVVASAYLAVLREHAGFRGPVDYRFHHLIEMLEKMDNLEGAKVHRWLGFVQGQLEFMEAFTIDQMRRHNKLGEQVSFGENDLKELEDAVRWDWMLK